MKKITLVSILLLALFSVTHSVAQIVAVVGISHDTSEGFTFVATQDIPAATTVRFTDNEYDAAANVFTFNGAPTGEFVVTWVSTTLVTKGTVLYVREGASNALTLTCSSGTCGTITWSTNTGVGNGAFSFASDGDSLYAYADTNDDPRDAIGEIYSVMYTDNLTIPANESPLSDWPNAIVTDGFSFPVSGADRIEFAFSPASQRDSRSKVDLENPGNYVSGPSATDLSIVPFTNFNLVGTNPVLSVAASPTSVNENSGTGMVYTFTLDAAAVGPITANFNVSGTATFTTDYTQSGAASFNASTGTVTIPNAATTATVTLTPVGDTTLEPDETAILTLAAGTGYTAGSPNSATGTILNDDTLAVTPVVAVTGGVHTIGMTEGFSFVALDDITAGTEVFFTENVFDNSLLRFTGAEAVVRWIAPAGGVLRGEVIVATEGPANVFTTTCNSGNCGTVTLISGVFDYASNGEALFAYTDTDTDHTNGITAISAVLFTGTSVTPGGNIPAGEDPSGVYVGSVVVDGFPASPPIRTEYRFPPERGVTVDQANFQNTANWFHAAAVATLDTTPFANIIIATGSANPTLTLTVAPNTTVEDSGVGMVYTFLLDAPAVGNITVNFTVAGTATFTTDYTQTGAATFAAASGTAVILNGNTSVDVTITPVVDTTVEPTETVELMIASGTGYDGGSPNAATGSITNDDTSMSDPLVAITGMNHVTPDGFSFVAAKDIPAGTTIYFTENAFDNTTLFFGTGEGVLAYTSPGAVIPAGDVIVIKETAPDVFSLTCNGNTGAPCGSIVLISGNLAHDTLGETLYAYEDSDNDPSNGVTDIYAVMFTGLSSGPSGGNIPASQDPSGIYLSALVIDGFPASAPNRSEYRFALGERGIPVGIADFENTAANWLHAQPNQDLSPIPFANLSIVVTFTALADLCVDAGVQAGLGGGSPSGGVYSGPGVTDDGNGMTYSFDPAAAGVGVHTLTYTSGGGSAMDDVEVFALPTVTFTALADLCVDAGVQAGLGGGSPSGGVYSGPGVTDDGNGTTYSFDPAAAGVGVHTLTYTFTDANGCTNSDSDDVEVFALPTVTFTALADLCVNAGVQAGVGGGSPSGGVYSGPGVTDDGNGTTYSFDPAAAGVGVHTLTYTFTDANGCTGSDSDDVEVFALPTVTFTALADLCIDAGVQAGLGGGSPNGGVYSGPGVTDDGNGMTYSFDPAAAGVGVHTLTYTFTDANGCTNSDSDDVEVFALPVVTFTALADLCVDAGVQAGLGGGSPSGGVYSGPGVTDDGNGTTYSFDPAAAGVGTHTLTYTFTDVNGCTDSASDDVEVFALPTVTFTAPPSPVCPGAVLTGQGGGTPTGGVYSGPGVTDDGNGMTYTFDAGAAGNGTHTLTYTFTDANGCTGSASDTVTVEDTQDPVVTCPADITVSNDPGNCSAIVTFMATATDNCPGVTTSSVPASGSAFPVGTTTVTVTATDASGNTDTCTFNVTVNDNEDPVAICPADITVSNDPGQCDAVVNFAPTATDNCPGVTVSSVPASGSVFPVGTTTVTVTATDVAGNTDVCTFDVTVDDNEDPIIACPADFNISNDAGVCGAVVNYGVGFGDNCPGSTLMQTAGQASGTVFPIGTTTNTFVVTDASGNTATCSFDVTVTDDEDPVITCPADITVNNDPGVCGADVTYSVPTSDNCPGETTVQTAGLASGSTFPVGTTTNTFVVTDASGNTATCSFDVTVIDNEDPVITCPADITVSNDPGVCGAVVSYTVTATDNCDALPSNISLNPLKDNTLFQEIPTNSNGAGQLMYVGQNGVGANYRGLLTFDVAGSLPAGATITAVSLTMTADHPTANNGAQNNNLHRLLEDWGEGASNNGTVPGSPGGGFGTGAIAPDATWNDAMLGTPWAGGPGGNFNPASSASQIVDANGPYTWSSATLVSDVQDMLDNPGTNFGWTVIGNETASGTAKRFGTRESGIPPVLNITYSLGGATLTLTQTAGLPSGSTFPIGTTTNTFVATDSAGNSATCSFDVTVNDTEDPVITCPADISVNNDAGLCSAIVTYAVTTSDNCPGETLAQTAGLPSGSAFPVGTTTNTFVVTDASGNTATCSFDVTVTDNEPPVANCVAPFTIQLDANGNASITPADIDDGSTDNCGIASLAISPSTFTCADVGPNTVTLTVTDVNGNASTCTTTVTVEDNVPPVAVCMDIDVFLDANGEASIVAADVDGGSTDACGIASLAIDIMDFTCSDLGPNNVTLTVTDNNGNMSTCIAVVTVIDNIPPTISCPADIMTSTDPDICGTVVTFPDAIALDNCAVTVVQTGGLLSGDVFPVGVNTVEFTATDEGGNMTVCSFTITVEDLTPPMAVCQDITIQLDANGDATITAADVDGGSFDNCGVITNISIDIDTFDCSDLGDNPVVLSVTDDNGNVGTCTAIVTVEDVTAPDALCMDITVQLDAAGSVNIVATDVDGGSTDACGIDTYSIDIDTFTCADVGANPVVLTVTDASGNSSSCTAIVTVEDVTAPVITCMDITVGLDQNGMATIVPGDILASSTDACGVGTAGLDISEFDCDDIGDVTVTLFVTDINGNTSSCTAVVTVKDGIDPILTCPADFTVEVEEGTTYTVPDFIADGTVTVTDNCTDPVTLTTQDPAPGTVLTEGVYTVTMTAEDDSTNAATCTFELTVLGVLGNETFDISTIVMYPNPAQNVVYLSNPQSIDLEQAAIYDATGRLVRTYDLRDMGTEKALDISLLSSATYLVFIQGPDGQITKQLIKE